MTKQTVLIFDFDGTIVDSGKKVFELLNHMAPDFGISRVNDSEIERLRTFGSREIMKELKVPVYKLPLILSRLRKELSEELPKLKPIKGVPQTLKILSSRGQRMGIITSNSEENTRSFLENNKINYFDFIVGGNSYFGKHRKLKKIIKDMKISSDQALYVGDETRDIEAARKAGVKIISVSWGFSPHETLQKYNPDWLISKPKDLITILKIN